MNAPLYSGSEFGNTPSGAVHAAPGVPLPVDDRSPEFAAEDAREAAYAAQAEAQWEGVPLLPWSKERDSLLSRLIALDLPGPTLEELAAVARRYAELCARLGPAAGVDAPPSLEGLVDFSLYFGSAAKLLFLATHEGAELEALRGNPARFLLAVEAWAAAAVADDAVPAACLLAAEIRTRWRQFKPLARPGGRAREDDAGNSPRPC